MDTSSIKALFNVLDVIHARALMAPQVLWSIALHTRCAQWIRSNLFHRKAMLVKTVHTPCYVGPMIMRAHVLTKILSVHSTKVVLFEKDMAKCFAKHRSLVYCICSVLFEHHLYRSQWTLLPSCLVRTPCISFENTRDGFLFWQFSHLLNWTDPLARMADDESPIHASAFRTVAWSHKLMRSYKSL